MSPLWHIADLPPVAQDVRFGGKADVRRSSRDVCYDTNGTLVPIGEK